MLDTYDSYLKEPRTMTFEQMDSLHKEMLTEIGKDSEGLELYQELCDAAESYAAMRAKWHRLPREEKMEQDSLRSSYHDSVIIHLNMIARYLRMQGKKAEWREKIGDETDDPYYRKTIGDFGCYIVFINSLCAR